MELAELGQGHENDDLIHQSDAVVVPIGNIGFDQFAVFFGVFHGQPEQSHDEILVVVGLVVFRFISGWDFGVRSKVFLHLIEELPKEEQSDLVIAVVDQVLVGVEIEKDIVVFHVIVDDIEDQLLVAVKAVFFAGHVFLVFRILAHSVVEATDKVFTVVVPVDLVFLLQGLQVTVVFKGIDDAVVNELAIWIEVFLGGEVLVHVLFNTAFGKAFHLHPKGQLADK